MEDNEVRQLIQELVSRGWRESQIAARLGVSQASVNRWRSGDRYPMMDQLIIAELRRMLRRKDPASVG
jgi:predicted transcriptional regulator